MNATALPWTVLELSAAIRAKDISPVEVTRTCLQRIDEWNGTLNAFITVLHKSSMAEARKAEREILKGRYLGPLHGIPYGAKDLYLTKGIRTTCGSRILSEFIPDEDAVLVTRLQRAGAILVGKLNMHEFAFGTTSENPHYGAVRNPWATSRITGGSSGGSAAAVAASLVPLTLGTDTGGSIRIPAALCGIAGLKPTYGRLSRRGIYPLCWSLDHPGPLAKTVSDLALAMDTLCDDGRSGQPSAGVPNFTGGLRGDLEGIRVGVPDRYFSDRLDPSVAEHVNKAINSLRKLGAIVRRVSIPLLQEAAAAASITLFAEATSSLEKWHRTRAADLGPDVRARLEWGTSVSAAEYLKAQRVRSRVRHAFARAFQTVDALVTPQLPTTAPLIGESEIVTDGVKEAVPDALTRLTRIFNLAGLPTVSVCCGFSPAGLPIGLQIASAVNHERVALQIGHAYEQSRRNVPTRRPESFAGVVT
jgi:aspartyl-tRNA(Asn)/glutamyl-tRNA(Gln) amidotransferase subunit A